MGRAKTIGKVGLLSTKEHNAPYRAALRELGFKVIELDGRCTSIPPSIKFCIIRVETVSHSTTDVALGWVRRSPATRTLAFCRGVSDVRKAAEDYRDKLKAGTALDYDIGVFPDAEKKPPVITGGPCWRAAKPPKIEKADKKEEAMKEKESFIVETVAKSGSLGTGIWDIRAAWEERYGTHPAKSTVGSWIAKAIAHGYIVNIGGKGRSNKGEGPKAAWYLSSVAQHQLSRAELKLEPGTRQREAFDAHLERLRGKPTPPPKRVDPPPPSTKLAKTVMEANASESITTECELLVLWLREWNVESMTVSKDGKVVLSSPPTKSPELRVSFTVE